MSETFTKLFGSITDSTIWAEDDKTRIVWITMLAMADQHGYVGASLPGLANRAQVSLEAAEIAVAKFLAPDLYSRSQEHEGRRIEVADRGWTLLNYGRYRDMRDEESRKEYERKRKRAQRSASQDVPDNSGQSRNVPDCPALSAQAEVEAEAESFSAPKRGKGTTRKASREAKPTWLTPYLDAWKREAGEPMVKEMAARMKPVEAEVGPERALAALVRWLQAGNAKFGVTNFAKAWREWDDDPTKIIETYLPNGEINPVVRAAFEQGARARGGR